MPLSWMRRNGGMSQALSPCTLCISAPWISGRLWIWAVMPSLFMRSSCASSTWSRCENDQRSPLIGRSLLSASYTSRKASIAALHLDMGVDVEAALGQRQQRCGASAPGPRAWCCSRRAAVAW